MLLCDSAGRKAGRDLRQPGSFLHAGGMSLLSLQGTPPRALHLLTPCKGGCGPAGCPWKCLDPVGPAPSAWPTVGTELPRGVAGWEPGVTKALHLPVGHRVGVGGGSKPPPQVWEKALPSCPGHRQWDPGVAAASPARPGWQGTLPLLVFSLTPGGLPLPCAWHCLPPGLPPERRCSNRGFWGSRSGSCAPGEHLGAPAKLMPLGVLSAWGPWVSPGPWGWP